MNILDSFANTNVLVIGDVMLDRYWWGNVSRISPEAPVPVVKMDNMTLAAGGAANVAANVYGLGATPVLVGIIGDDTEGELLPDVLSKVGVSHEHLITIAGRPTTVKTRIIAHSQQMARIDQETDANLSANDEESVWSRIEPHIKESHAIVISDYAKGFLSDLLLRRIIDLANNSGVSVLVDPKGKDYKKYRAASLLTPNRREAADACGLEENTQQMVNIAGNRLLTDLNLSSVLITQGEDGMTVFRKSGEPFHLDTLAREVYDVTGAGDTVIASLAVAIGSGADLETAANIANTAAGLVVEQVGTTAISIRELRNAISDNI
ncbi:MAG TPA: D-glycero-beta-D-manno-heptose-7-phosphate kinase [Pyrinomonadaceae bacterium]|nr:D-glycero-beta-D-manno-heptose-7-phosphate kinase [Pyrinomonadaceae bacterium]